MSCIYAIPFGQADCFVVALDTGNGRRYVLIDGGTRKHGRNDKGHIYYTEDFLKKISPRKAVITSDMDNIKKYSAEWKRILTGTDIYVIEDKIMEIGIEE